VTDCDLPYTVTISQAFSQRLPAQRVLDLIDQQEIAKFAELAETQPFRIVAFRALLRDFPHRDPGELWRHAYDVECDVVTPDPTDNGSRTDAPVFVPTGE
jgi:hypothetical protein